MDRRALLAALWEQEQRGPRCLGSPRGRPQRPTPPRLFCPAIRAGETRGGGRELCPVAVRPLPQPPLRSSGREQVSGVWRGSFTGEIPLQAYELLCPPECPGAEAGGGRGPPSGPTSSPCDARPHGLWYVLGDAGQRSVRPLTHSVGGPEARGCARGPCGPRRGALSPGPPETLGGEGSARHSEGPGASPRRSVRGV